jgi:hypothetical protein
MMFLFHNGWKDDQDFPLLILDLGSTEDFSFVFIVGFCGISCGLAVDR